LLGPGSEQRADDESIKSDEDKFESLTEASMKDQWDLVELLLKGGFKENDTYKASYNALRNKFAGSMLRYAAWKGYRAMVRLCLDNGEDIDCMDSNGWRALHFAADKGHEATVQQLLNHAADKEARTNNGFTALHLASRGGHDSIIQLLIKHFGTDRDAKDNDGSTALHLAVAKGHDSTAQLLIRNFSVDVKTKNNLGQTARVLLLRHM
jgi:ankyrin repeat protein